MNRRGSRFVRELENYLRAPIRELRLDRGSYTARVSAYNGNSTIISDYELVRELTEQCTRVGPDTYVFQHTYDRYSPAMVNASSRNVHFNDATAYAYRAMVENLHLSQHHTMLGIDTGIAEISVSDYVMGTTGTTTYSEQSGIITKKELDALISKYESSVTKAKPKKSKKYHDLYWHRYKKTGIKPY